MSAPPRPPRSPEEQARLEQVMRELFEEMTTFNKTLGLKLENMKAATISARLEMRPELVGHYLYGRLHGGVISATLDAIAGQACILGLAEKHADESSEQIMQRFARVGTIDLRIDYLRPGLGSVFHATAEITRLGGRIGSTTMRLTNENGTLIATGAASYILS